MKIQTKKSKCRDAVREYLLHNDPYKKSMHLGVNIAEMSRYAKKTNRKISELTAEEAKKFSVS